MPKIDIIPFVLSLSIVDKDLGVVKLADSIHPAQIDILNQVNHCLNNNLPIRIIVLKARQIGMSTIIEAIHFAMAFMKNNFRGLVMAHETDSSEHLLSMQQNYFDYFVGAEAYTQKNKGAKILSWVETKSQIRIATAKNKGAGRSRTLQFVHGSEVGFWPDPDTLMAGLDSTVPLRPVTFIFLESTANGVGDYFHRTWNEACNGDIDYLPRFYPWWTHPEYLATQLKIPFIKGHLDEEERKLIAMFREPPKARWNDYTQPPLSNAEILDRLSWRRYAIRNICKGDLAKFHQEYPATPEEAFLSTGTNVFPSTQVDEIFYPEDGNIGDIVREGDKVRFQPFREGKLKVFRDPRPGAKYVVSGDAKRAIEGDYACAQVFDRRTWEQVAVYRDKVDNVTFGEIMMNLGMYYNTAILVPEIEGGGYGTIAVLLDRGYPHIWQHQKGDRQPGQMDNSFGWSTNWKTKSQALGNLKKAIIDHMIVLHDRHTYAELINYVALGGGKFGNGKEADHDDTVMSMAIAVTIIIYEAMELINTPEIASVAVVPKAAQAINTESFTPPLSALLAVDKVDRVVEKAPPAWMTMDESELLDD